MLSPVDGKKPPLAVIFGLQGSDLTPAQKAFFREANPLGFILFGINGNIESPEQLHALTGNLQDLRGGGPASPIPAPSEYRLYHR